MDKDLDFEFALCWITQRDADSDGCNELTCSDKLFIDTDEINPDPIQLVQDTYKLTQVDACGSVDYTFSSELSTDPTADDLFAVGGRATFDQASMSISFNDIKNIPLGVYEINVEIRQKSAAGVLSGVAYTEKFNIHVLACLTE